VKVFTPEKKTPSPYLSIGVALICVLLSAEVTKESWSQTDKPESQVEEGERLISELGCIACHEIKDHQSTIRDEAPNLTFEGDIVRREWLFEFLKNPRKIRPAIKARMPDFRLSDREALAITEYLGSLVDTEPNDMLLQAQKNPRKFGQQEMEAAKKLMSNEIFGCLNCHVFGDQTPQGKPEEWAPDLTRVKSRINPDFFFKWFKAPDRYRTGTKMPAFLPDKDSGPDDILNGDEWRQAAALRDYLVSVGRPEKFPAYAEAKAKYPDVTVTEGRTFVKSLNCTGCHEMAVLPEGRRVGPNLTFQGSRVGKEWMVNFLRAPFTIKPEYGLLGSPTRMPTFKFSAEELDAIAAYISQALVDNEAGQNPGVEATLAINGKKLFREKTCNNCHRIADDPAGIGPNLTDAGKRLQPGWTISFIQNPEHYLNTRMPNLKISPEEARALASYVLGAKN
jgi:mono/diheme cytochrome c family protein